MASYGAFVWYDLMTTDTAAAIAFYQKVLGWNAETSSDNGFPYTHLSVGQTPIGGLMALPEEACKAGARPAWLGYLWVADLEGATETVISLGGAVHKAPTDIPGVGRFSVVADPQGAAFYLFQTDGPAEGPELPAGTPGTIGWRELYARDHGKAFDFYNVMFGWTKGEAIDMGPAGVYQLYDYDGLSRGGMMNKPAEMPMAAWIFYFNVEDIDAAIARATGAGGQILNGPMQVPGGSWIAQALDPQGAMFALVGPRKA